MERTTTLMNDNALPRVFWHRELPPPDAILLGEHVVDADSGRVPGRFTRSDETWQQCHGDLMEHVRARLLQEVARLGGDYAHVLAEHVEGKHDDVADESWLHGVFTYTLYQRGAER